MKSGALEKCYQEKGIVERYKNGPAKFYREKE